MINENVGELGARWPGARDCLSLSKQDKLNHGLTVPEGEVIKAGERHMLGDMPVWSRSSGLCLAWKSINVG